MKKIIVSSVILAIIAVSLLSFFHRQLKIKLEAVQAATLSTVPESIQPTHEPQVQGIATVAPESPNWKTQEDVAIAAESGMVMDAETGEILYAKNHTEVRPIASLTKLMTALVYLDLNNQTIPNKSTSILPGEYTIGGTLQASSKETLTAKDLFNLMLVGSVNNTTNSLTRTTGLPKEEFVQKMNEKAKELGLVSATFTDPTGLETTNTASTLDITTLARNAFQNEIIQAVSSQKNYTFTFGGSGREKTVNNTNELIRTKQHLNWKASKTGYLNEAGWCVITKVEHNNKEYIISILGGTSKPQHFYDTLILIDAIQEGVIE